MQLAVEVEALDGFGTVGFEAAVEVVDLDPGCGGGRPVEHSGRECLAEWVLAQLLPSRDAVVAFIQLFDEFGDLGRFVLEVCIHRDDDLAFDCCKARSECCGLPLIAAEAQGGDVVGMCLFECSQLLPRVVGAAVVDENDFEAAELLVFDGCFDLLKQRAQCVLLVAERDDEGQLNGGGCVHQWSASRFMLQGHVCIR